MVDHAPQNQFQQMEGQMAAMQAQQAEEAALRESGAMMAKLQQLVQLRESGMLTEQEFATAKARLLAA
jgi:hypothetical protein